MNKCRSNKLCRKFRARIFTECNNYLLHNSVSLPFNFFLKISINCQNLIISFGWIPTELDITNMKRNLDHLLSHINQSVILCVLFYLALHCKSPKVYLLECKVYDSNVCVHSFTLHYISNPQKFTYWIVKCMTVAFVCTVLPYNTFQIPPK